LLMVCGRRVAFVTAIVVVYCFVHLLG
jgi:hypothetical protein